LRAADGHQIAQIFANEMRPLILLRHSSFPFPPPPIANIFLRLRARNNLLLPTNLLAAIR
jgi:hypothetical protein